jgi:hypothetical protein
MVTLTKRIINTRQISEIVIKNNTYYIYFSHTLNNGIFLFTIGWNDSNVDKITIDLEKDKEDYDIITNWIKNI